MEIASAAAGEATKSAIVHVEREFGYFIHFRRNTNTLKENIQQLTAIKRDVQASIDAALTNDELVKETVQDWMRSAYLVRNFNVFASRDSTAEEILKAILDDVTNLLGIYGMPGVGKTTLIKAIANQVKEKQLFQEVVVVIVSQKPSLIKLQGDIAKRLDLCLDGDDLTARADRFIKLSELGIPYKNKGKCCKVVFTTRFGGVCEAMEADAKIEVAILPEGDSWILFQQKSGNVEDSLIARGLLNECKGLPLAIVTLGLALRNKDAIVWEDALKQLRKSVFKGMSSVVSSIKLSYDFLKSESIKICFLFCCLFPEDNAIVLDTLLSYVMGEKLLEDVDTYDEARGRLHSIMDILVSCGLLLRDDSGYIMMHDVIRDVAISIATEDHGFIVKAGRNLSEWPDMELGNCKRLSMMYNRIEQLPVLSIKAPYLLALILDYNYQLTELPPDVFADMKCLMTLDLSRTAIQSLPPSLSFLQNLRTLLLDLTDLTNLSPIDKLEKLEVFSLRGCGKIIEFPEEMGNLSNLKVLDLTNTSFINSINPNLISKLHRLETFHLLNSNVYEAKPDFEEFFREIGSLSRLTSLELQFHNRELWYIDIPGPWQNLTRFLFQKNYQLGRKNGFLRILMLHKIAVKQVANWVLVLLGRTYFLELYKCGDVESLTELGAKGMNQNLKFLSLWTCRRIECLVNNTGLLESDENAFSNLEEIEIEDMRAFVEICKGTPPPRLLSKLKTLSFHSCNALLTAVPRKLMQNLLNLEDLQIAWCENLLYVLQPEEEEETESSLVSNIPIISEPLVLPIFPNLKIFKIKYTKIRYVFTMRIARNLLLLEVLDIEDCSEMEVILKYDDGEDIKCDEEFNDTAILPRLKDLTTWTTPKLKSFTNQSLVMELPSLEDLTVCECEILERLPFGTTSEEIQTTARANHLLPLLLICRQTSDGLYKLSRTFHHVIFHTNLILNDIAMVQESWD
ncbi:hypothetical protein ACHQM5_009093 [Ranunculus cassubicifolius]